MPGYTITFARSARKELQSLPVDVAERLLKRIESLITNARPGGSDILSRSKVGFMKYRAVIKKSENWWIGWLIDLPGVNAQEKTKDALIESLRIGAEDMLMSEIQFEPDSIMTTISVKEPEWAAPADK
jgi:predicted RNase H-like HicB family nuclease